jgi:hypothetical protein
MFDFDNETFVKLNLAHPVSGCTYVLKNSDEYGVTLTTVRASDEFYPHPVQHGATMFVSFGEFHSDYYYYVGVSDDDDGHSESEQDFIDLNEIGRSRGFIVTAYEFWEYGKRCLGALREVIYSNRTEYFIDNRHLGNYYNVKYNKILLSLNRRLTLTEDQITCHKLETVSDFNHNFTENKLAAL